MIKVWHVLAAMSFFVFGQVSASVGKMDDPDQYQEHVSQLLNAGNFDALEKLAGEARSGKGRFVGGSWKLFEFYLGIDRKFQNVASHDMLWEAHLRKLRQWGDKKPKSITAQVALANAILSWAGEIRGSGYAQSVDPKAMNRFKSKVREAHDVLNAAAKLTEKCPAWYSTMQSVALLEGWDKASADKLLTQATALEPNFYHVYRMHANYLRPQWYGDEGEVEAWAEKVRTDVGGQQGDFLYFEIATTLFKPHLEQMSWPNIKAGYLALRDLYGVSNRKRNRYAYATTLAGDKEEARRVFSEIGDEWDEGVWGSWDQFRSIRAAATR